MKVGILTFSRTTNYGAILQAYALQQILRKNGFESEIIDYYSNNIYSYYDFRIFSGNTRFKTKLGKILRYRYNKQVFNYFKEFENERIFYSDRCNTLSDLVGIEQNYDAVICGSDQVWNPKAIANEFDVYLLKTVKQRKISYAASAGNIHNWQPYLKVFWDALHEFDAISVREKEMVKPVESLSEKKVYQVLDPTLLIEEEDWIKLEVKCKVPEKYIFVYFLGKNSLLVKNVKRLQQETGLPVVSLGRKLGNGIREIRVPAGPQHFLFLIHHSSYVLTSSFHGTVFSILFGKPFLTFGNADYNSRIYTLLSDAGLTEYFIDKESSNLDIERKIRACEEDSVLEELKNDSITFLLTSLKNGA